MSLSRIEPCTEAFAGSRPIIAKAIVDLPEPDSPTMANASPATRSKLAPLTAGYHLPLTQNSTTRSRTRTTGTPPSRPALTRSVLPITATSFPKVAPWRRGRNGASVVGQGPDDRHRLDQRR